MKKSNWNRLYTYIRNAYAKGSATVTNNAKSGIGAQSPGNGGSSGLPSGDDNIFMTAAAFNELSEALCGLGGPSSVSYKDPITGSNKSSMSKDVDICWGSYFSSLESYANSLQYKDKQCDDCNINCNVQCNTCLKCHNDGNCDKCNLGCQSDASSSCCSSCNRCQCSAQGGQNTGGTTPT